MAKKQTSRKRTGKKTNSQEHIYGKKVRCATDSRGYERHRNLNFDEIRVHETDGFIPLWAEDVTLRYRFNEWSFEKKYGDKADEQKAVVQKLFDDGLSLWGDAVPVKFTYNTNASDFEIFIVQEPDCDSTGCVLASAFFPDGGRHRFNIYPTCFDQSREEQVETFAHEQGHIFGLRHFFANISETDFPSHLFGEDSKFSIMNYGRNSFMTDSDRSDLKNLYAAVWNGELTEIDSAPIQLMYPYSSVAVNGQAQKLAARAAKRHPVKISISGRKVTVE